VLGKGQYGEVRKAKHQKTKGKYAVKTIIKSRVRRKEILRRENEFLLRATHPNICNVVDIFEDNSHMYIVQDFYNGGELFDEIIERYTNNRPFTEKDICSIVQQLLSGLSYCHDTLGICHRDLKPENIMLRKRGELDVVIIDFGLAVTIDSTDESGGHTDHMSTQVGTPYYMAPEIFKGDYNRACDMWSLGVITYVMMCGYPPFNGGDEKGILQAVKNPKNNVDFDLRERWGNASKESMAFIKSLLNRNPRARPSAQVALEHPWFKKTNTAEIPLAISIGPKLQRFHDMSQLKRMASVVAAGQVKESAEVAHLKKIFQELDVNHDSSINKEELKQAMKEWPEDSNINIDEIFSDLDVNGTGCISRDEFLAATVPPILALQDSNLERAFNVFDVDRSGFITLENLKAVVDGDEAELRRLLNDGDFCHDGKISLEEFKHMMRMPDHKVLLSRQRSPQEKNRQDVENMTNFYKKFKPSQELSRTVKIVKQENLRIGFHVTEVQHEEDDSVLFFIQNVASPSLAENAGLKEWDVLQEINGQPTSSLGLRAVRDSLRQAVTSEKGECQLLIYTISEEKIKEVLSTEAGHGNATFALSKNI
jgi:calcium-dependent protein kinase